MCAISQCPVLKWGSGAVRPLQGSFWERVTLAQEGGGGWVLLAPSVPIADYLQGLARC